MWAVTIHLASFPSAQRGRVCVRETRRRANESFGKKTRRILDFARRKITHFLNLQSKRIYYDYFITLLHTFFYLNK